MRVYRMLIALVALLLFFSLGEPVQMVEEANANCCNPRWCGYWSIFLFGGVKLQGTAAIVTVGKESYSFEVSEELAMRLNQVKDKGTDDYSKQITTTGAFGFIILRGFGEIKGEKKVMVTDFIPADRETHDKKVSAQVAVDNYNKMYAEQYGLKKEYGLKK